MQECIKLLPLSYINQLGVQEEDLYKILGLWGQTYRKYHSLEHLYDLLDQINSNDDLSKDNKNLLSTVALFHDVIYHPRKRDNVAMSVELFKRCIKSSKHKDIDTIARIIQETDSHISTCKLSKIFCDYDTQILRQGFSSLLQWEHKISSEFQFMDYKKYADLRIQFLEPYVKTNPSIITLIEYVRFRKPSIAIYPGSFAPFHSGHMNILNKAENIFDKVIVAVGVNPDKDLGSGDVTARIQELEDILVNREVLFYQGYLTDLVQSLPKKTAIVRGLRNGYDLEYEMNQLRFIEDMANISPQVCFIPCDREYSYISSTAIRNMAKFEGNREEKYLPKKVII
ncbi:MAG: adenylyltransferase/cytidyltransferase family protein [Candidatus Cloacimonetes bacterium]|nr:adenylyltransferase/cytidyltransferase family protein [Candidatus Cloacimonadota bacterium]